MSNEKTPKNIFSAFFSVLWHIILILFQIRSSFSKNRIFIDPPGSLSLSSARIAALRSVIKAFVLLLAQIEEYKKGKPFFKASQTFYIE